MHPIIVIPIGLGAFFILRWVLFERVTIFEYEKGLRYRKGKFQRILDAGRYWCLKSDTTIQKVDMRIKSVAVPGQEVLSADNVTIKASLAAQYEIADPDVAVNKVENYPVALYTELQVAFREVVGSFKIDELLEKRKEIGQKVFDLALPKLRTFGLNLRMVNIKDIMFPGDLKKIFAQVVKAQKEGHAALEKARGETAALRNLANAARMLEDNPTLMQLRLLQSIGEGSGNTVVLGMPSQAIPMPLKAKSAESPQKSERKTDEGES